MTRLARLLYALLLIPWLVLVQCSEPTSDITHTPGDEERLTQEPSERDTFEAGFTHAETARKAAAEAGYEWLDTREMLEQAKLAACKEEWKKAIRLAEQAEKQGEDALAQAEHEAQAWQARVVR